MIDKQVKDILVKMVESDYKPTDDELMLIDEASGDYLLDLDPEIDTSNWQEYTIDDCCFGVIKCDPRDVELFRKISKCAQWLYAKFIELDCDYVSAWEYGSMFTRALDIGDNLEYLCLDDYDFDDDDEEDED